LQGQALLLFEYHLSKRWGGKDIETTDQELLELVIRDIGLDYISRHAIRVQKYYMRRCLFMGPNTTVQQFVERLNELNHYLLFFPEECPMPLTQDEIIEILDQAKPPNQNVSVGYRQDEWIGFNWNSYYPSKGYQLPKSRHNLQCLWWSW
jgi:hypothetical protein